MSRLLPWTATRPRTSSSSVAATRASGPPGTSSRRRPGVRVVRAGAGRVRVRSQRPQRRVHQRLLRPRRDAPRPVRPGRRAGRDRRRGADDPRDGRLDGRARRRRLVPPGRVHRGRLVARPGRRLGGAHRDRPGPGHRGPLPRPVEGRHGRLLHLAGVRGRPLRRRRRHRPAGPPRARPAPRVHGGRRPHLRALAGFSASAPAPAWRPSPPAASVRAGQAVLGINAWAGAWKGFGRSIVPRASYMAITAPAPERLAEINWTTGVSIYDYRSALRYLRTTPDGRIALGVGGERGTWSGQDRPALRLRRAGHTARDRCHPPVLPGLPGRADRGPLGRPHRRRCHAHALRRHARGRQRALRPGLHGERRWSRAPAGQGHGRPGPGYRERGHPAPARGHGAEALPAPAVPQPRRSRRQRGHGPPGRRDRCHGLGEPAGRLSWRSCRAGWGTTSARRRGAVRLVEPGLPGSFRPSGRGSPAASARTSARPRPSRSARSRVVDSGTGSRRPCGPPTARRRSPRPRG